MDAKRIAREASSWYISNLDPFAPHASNINTYLRGLVLALTLSILESRQGLLELEQSPQEVSYLSNVVTEWTEQEQDVHDNLGRRTRARMDGFIAGCTLAVPNDLDATPTADDRPKNHARHIKDASKDAGLSGFKPNNDGSPMLGASIQMPLRRNVHQTRFPQFRPCELTTRLELYVRSLNHVRSTGQQIVVEMESPRAVKARANAIVRSFVATVGCVKGMRPCLTLLLQCLTRELLAFDCICNEISKVIRRVVSEYEHQTSFASLAFLSTPEDSAETRLTPLVLSYLQYLRANWKTLAEECELERMLSTVLQPDMRNLLKTIEFKSIGHLLEVCHNFQMELQSIDLPPDVGGITGEDLDSMCSNSKVIQQAIRDLRREIILVNGHKLPPVNSRKELLQMLSQMLSSRSLFLPGKRKSKKKGLSHASSCPSMIPSQTTPTKELDSEGFISSGNEGDTDDGNAHVRRAPIEQTRRNGRRSFHVSTVDLMTRRLLIACSRTGMGGDAYFIVRDLFGGDDVEVVPSRTPTAVGQARAGTIEMSVRLASVTIKCHGSLDVYPKSRVGDCEPLIQLHTTTTETICLQEVRVSDTGQEKVDGDSSGDDDNEEGSKMMLQERKTDRTGWRTVAIRPALYEAVEKWTTPS